MEGVGQEKDRSLFFFFPLVRGGWREGGGECEGENKGAGECKKKKKMYTHIYEGQSGPGVQAASLALTGGGGRPITVRLILK